MLLKLSSVSTDLKFSRSTVDTLSELSKDRNLVTFSQPQELSLLFLTPNLLGSVKASSHLTTRTVTVLFKKLFESSPTNMSFPMLNFTRRTESALLSNSFRRWVRFT